MGRRVAWAGGVVLLGVLVAGCGDGVKTIQTARPIGEPESPKGVAELTPGQRPEKSDPAAAAVVTAAVNAHTNNQPGLLQKLKTVTFRREGAGTAGGPTPIRQKWEVYAAWPDRFRLKADLQSSQGPQTVILACVGREGWRSAPPAGKIAMDPKQAEDFRVETTGEWLCLLFPLIDPATIVAPAAGDTVNGRPTDGVRLWHPDLSDAILQFDHETKLLAKVVFDGRENGQKVMKEILILGTKPYAEVTLAEKTAVKSNGNELADWTMTSLECLPAIDPKLFEAP